MDNLKELKNRLIETAAQMVSKSGRDDKDLWDELVIIAEGIIEKSYRLGYRLGRGDRQEEREEMQRTVNREQERSKELARLLKKASKKLKCGKLSGRIDAILKK